MDKKKTDLYGLVGFPLGHSFSKPYFTDKFSRQNIPAEYRNFEIENIADIRDIIATNPQLRGLNVTIPHKELVIPFLDSLSEDAAKIGAVNVISIQRKDEKIHLTGYNTDYIGFRYALSQLIHPETHPKALILGTGGASKAVAYALSSLHIEYTLVSHSGKKNAINYSELTTDILQAHRIIINTTPLGTFPHTETFPPIPYSLLTLQHLAYDLVYNPAETMFLQKAKAQGAVIKNGEEMLQRQAEAAWDIWNR